MHRFFEYLLFFVTMVLLQYLLFDNLNFGAYIHPLVYITFIIMLPIETRPIVVLLAGLMLGITMDLFCGASGLHTIATVATAYSRRALLYIFTGREQVKIGGIPTPQRIGKGAFIKYSGAVVSIQSIIYFTVEAFSFHHFHLTLLRIVISAILTTLLVYFSRMLLLAKNRDSRKGLID